MMNNYYYAVCGPEAKDGSRNLALFKGMESIDASSNSITPVVLQCLTISFDVIIIKPYAIFVCASELQTLPCTCVRALSLNTFKMYLNYIIYLHSTRPSQWNTQLITLMVMKFERLEPIKARRSSIAKFYSGV